MAADLPSFADTAIRFYTENETPINRIGVIAGILGVSAIGLVTGFFRWLQRISGDIWRRIRGLSALPRETLRIIQTDGQWFVLPGHKPPRIHLVGTFWVTNISKGPSALLKIEPARIKAAERIHLSAIPLPESESVQQRFSAVLECRAPLFSRDLRARFCFFDGMNNRHSVQLTFRAPQKPRPAIVEVREDLSAIADPVEQNIVAVLKHEITRYTANGRAQGGLGSLEFSERNKTSFRTVPSAAQTAGGGQLIVRNPEQWAVSSENLRAFHKLCAGTNVAEKHRMAAMLISRLNRRTEYAQISYFILICLVHIGVLKGALSILNRDVRNDGKFGFGDATRLLDTLLMLRHDSFSTDDLNHIGKFAHTLAADKWQIEERIAAIQTFRILNSDRQAESAMDSSHTNTRSE